MPNNVIVPSIGAAGGLILLWKDGFAVNIIHQTGKIIHTQVTNDPSKGDWYLSCVYGTPYNREKLDQWPYINNLSRNIYRPWVLIGDLNVTFSPSDKNNESTYITPSEVHDLIKDSDLSDLGFCGNPFTWTSNSHGTGHIKSRIDRALVNSE